MNRTFGLIDTAEACRRLAFTAGRVSQLVSQGKLKPAMRVGVCYLFRERDIERLRQSRIEGLQRKLAQLLST